MAQATLRDLDERTLKDLLTNPPVVAALFSAAFWQDRERWPLFVRYDHRDVTFVPRDHFMFDPKTERPSDCVWIIPGSTP